MMDDGSDETARCWFCGAASVMVGRVHAMDRAEPLVTVIEWPEPAPDHDHAVEPPSPASLERSGHEALTRIYTEAGPLPMLGWS
jgi:hypothetical protein